MNKQSSSRVKEGVGGTTQIVWVAISLAVQESYGLRVEAVKPFGLILVLRYSLPCSGRENSLTRVAGV